MYGDIDCEATVLIGKFNNRAQKARNVRRQYRLAVQHGTSRQSPPTQRCGAVTGEALRSPIGARGHATDKPQCEARICGQPEPVDARATRKPRDERRQHEGTVREQSGVAQVEPSEQAPK